MLQDLWQAPQRRAKPIMRFKYFIFYFFVFSTDRELRVPAAWLPTVFRDRAVSPLEDEPRSAAAILDQLNGT